MDPDGDPLVYQWRQLAGPSVIVDKAGTAKASFDAPTVLAGADMVFQLTVSDDKGERGSALASVTVRSGKSYAILVIDELVDETADGGETVWLVGSARGGVGALSYHWEQIDGIPISLVDSRSASAKFKAPNLAATEILTFQLTVRDEVGNSASRLMGVVVHAQLVVAELASATAEAGAQVLLSGSAQGGVGELSYRWQQTKGPSVSIADPNAASTSFAAPAPEETETLTFRLTVTDEVGQSESQTMQVEVYAELVVEELHSAGAEGEERVILSWSAHGGAGALSYRWEQTAGTPVSIANPNLASTSFIAPVLETTETLTFKVTVTDEAGHSASRVLTIDVYAALVLEEIDDATASAGQEVVLAGTVHGGVGTFLYRWEQVSGTSVSIADPNAASTSFAAPALAESETLTFRLTVEDGVGHSASRTMQVEVYAELVVEELDPIGAEGGEEVILSGSAHGGVGALSYWWEQTSGAPVSIADPNSASTSLTAPVLEDNETLTFLLTVTDEVGQSASRVLNVEVYAELVLDEIDDVTTYVGQEVALAGTVHGGVGALSYRWEQLSGTPVSIADPNAASTSFTAPDLEETEALTFQLTVEDEGGHSTSRTTQVEVVAAYFADAGEDIVAAPGFEVTLNGSVVGGSGTATYKWFQLDGPPVVLSDANDLTPTFTAPLLQEDVVLQFLLAVDDDEKGISVDTVNVTIDVPVVRFNTTMGEFAILLRPDVAPLGVSNFLQYVEEGFYAGLIIHRVIPPAEDPNDMAIIQGGGWYPDFSPTMRHDPIPIESDNGLTNVRGTVAYARTAVPDSATSEFFINLNDNPGLDYVSAGNPGYAVFGEVIEGMAVVDAIGQVARHDVPTEYGTFQNVPVTPIIITEVTRE